MPRKLKVPKPVDPLKCPFSRNEMGGLAKRYLKDGAYDGARDLMVMYKLWKQYPEEAFWRVHQLPFKLNAAFWFLGKDGQEQLARDWSIFHLELPKPEQVVLAAEKVGEDVVIARKPRTMAELLKS